MNETQQEELQERSFNKYDSAYSKKEDSWEDGFAELEALRRRESGETEVEQQADSTTVRQRESKVRSKKFVSLKRKVKKGHHYPLAEAIQKVSELTRVGFDASIELHLVSKKEGLGGTIELPHGTGKVKRVAIFGTDTIAKIDKKQLDFDVLLATPDQMKEVAKYARVLGPRGLMPNPKNGTITADPTKTVKEMAAQTKLTFKCEKKAPLIHLTIGKFSQGVEAISANLQAVFTSINPKQLKKAALSSTMSPSVKLDLGSIE